MMFTIITISIFSLSVLAFAGAWFLFSSVKKKSIASKKIFDLTFASKKNSRVDILFIGKNLGLVGIVVFTTLLYLFGWQIACGFLAGLAVSVIISFFTAEIITSSSGKILESTKNDLSLAFSIAKKSAVAVCLMIFSLLLLVVITSLAFSIDINVLFAFALGAGILTIFSKAEKSQPKSFEFASGYFGTFIIAIVVVVITMQNSSGEKIATIFPLILISIALISAIVGSMFWRVKKGKNILSFLPSIFVFLILLFAGYYFAGRYISFSYFNLQTITLGALGFLGLTILVKAFEVLLNESTTIKNSTGADDQFQNLDLLASFDKKSRLFIKYSSALATFAVSALLFIYFTSKVSGDFLLSNPVVIAGLVVGGILPYLFILSKKTGRILETSAIGILPIFLTLVFGSNFFAGILAGMILLGLFLAISREDGLLASPLIKSSLLVPIIAVSYILVDYTLKIRLIIAGAATLILVIYFVSVRYKQIWSWFLKLWKKYVGRTKVVESKIG